MQFYFDENQSPPPPPRKKKRHPLPKPIYPGSTAAKEKERQNKYTKDQKERERSGKNRNPFGDSLIRDIERMLRD